MHNDVNVDPTPAVATIALVYFGCNPEYETAKDVDGAPVIVAAPRSYQFV